MLLERVVAPHNVLLCGNEVIINKDLPGTGQLLSKPARNRPRRRSHTLIDASTQMNTTAK